MATTNMQQWNPTATNQETDAAYTADSQRSGGATDPSVFLSILANKVYYQSSTYLTALFQAFANKGFTTSDSNLSTLTAVCANFLTTADIRPQILNLAYSPSITLDGSKANAWFLTLDGNLTLSTTGFTDGQVITLVYIQDSAGGRTITFPTEFFEAQQPDPRTGACSAQAFIYTTLAGGFFRPIGPLASENTTFVDNLSVDNNASILGTLTTAALTLSAPGSAGQVLTNVGGNFVPVTLPRTQGTAIDQTGARAFGTVYQNNTGGIIYVSGYGNTNSGGSTGSTEGRIGAASPTSTVWLMTVTSTITNGTCGFCFAVPAGWFYEVLANTRTQGGDHAVTSLGSWVETAIS